MTWKLKVSMAKKTIVHVNVLPKPKLQLNQELSRFHQYITCNLKLRDVLITEALYVDKRNIFKTIYLYSMREILKGAAFCHMSQKNGYILFH